MTIAPVTLAELTSATIGGTGVFDVLMKASKAHLDVEYAKDRIKGAEYSTVYLGSLTQVLQTAVQFLLTKDKSYLEAQLIEQQVLVAQQEVLKSQQEVLLAQAQIQLSGQQLLNLQEELKILQANVLKIPAEIALLTAQKLKLEQDTLNGVIEGTVLTAQKCKLDAEFDVLGSTNLKTQQETTLLLWKTNTEKAQTIALGVDTDSVVGKQKDLYGAQTKGFKRDAEQKAADIMVRSWNVRRTTNEATEANTAHVGDVHIAQVVDQMMAGLTE